MFALVPSAAPFGAFPFAALRRAPEPDATVALFARDVARVIEPLFRCTFAGGADFRAAFAVVRLAPFALAAERVDGRFASARFAAPRFAAPRLGAAFFFATLGGASALGVADRGLAAAAATRIGFVGAGATLGFVARSARSTRGAARSRLGAMGFAVVLDLLPAAKATGGSATAVGATSGTANDGDGPFTATPMCCLTFATLAPTLCNIRRTSSVHFR